MSQHDDGVRLRHMFDAAKQAIEFTRGRSNADLYRDVQLALALTRLVEIIGEAAKSVSAGTRAKLPQIPWRAIAGTRDRLVHVLERPWQIVTADLPPLVGVLEAALDPER